MTRRSWALQGAFSVICMEKSRKNGINFQQAFLSFATFWPFLGHTLTPKNHGIEDICPFIAQSTTQWL